MSDYIEKYKKRLRINDGTIGKINKLEHLIEEGKLLTNYIERNDDLTLTFVLDTINNEKFTVWITKCIAMLEDEYQDSINTRKFLALAEKTIECDIDTYNTLINILNGLYEFENTKVK